jgi:hypothetical protein
MKHLWRRLLRRFGRITDCELIHPGVVHSAWHYEQVAQEARRAADRRVAQ